MISPEIVVSSTVVITIAMYCQFCYLILININTKLVLFCFVITTASVSLTNLAHPQYMYNVCVFAKIAASESRRLQLTTTPTPHQLKIASIFTKSYNMHRVSCIPQGMDGDVAKKATLGTLRMTLLPNHLASAQRYHI